MFALTSTVTRADGRLTRQFFSCTKPTSAAVEFFLAGAIPEEILVRRINININMMKRQLSASHMGVSSFLGSPTRTLPFSGPRLRQDLLPYLKAVRLAASTSLG